MPRQCRGKEARKTENAVGNCVKRDQERVGGELRTANDRRSWRLQIENAVREK